MVHFTVAWDPKVCTFIKQKPQCQLNQNINTCKTPTFLTESGHTDMLHKETK